MFKDIWCLSLFVARLDSDLRFSEFLSQFPNIPHHANSLMFQILISEYSILSHIINLGVRYDVLGSKCLHIPLCRIS